MHSISICKWEVYIFHIHVHVYACYYYTRSHPTCISVVPPGSSRPRTGCREIHTGRGEMSMKKLPVRLPQLEREKDVVWIWWSVTRVPTSTMSLSRHSFGEGGTLCDWTNELITYKLAKTDIHCTCMYIEPYESCYASFSLYCFVLDFECGCLKQCTLYTKVVYIAQLKWKCSSDTVYIT